MMVIEPKKHSAEQNVVLEADEYRHVLMVLDVSPSMRLVDAGPGHALREAWEPSHEGGGVVLGATLTLDEGSQLRNYLHW